MNRFINFPEVNLHPIILNEIVSIAMQVQASHELVTTSVLSVMGAVLQSVIEVQPPVGDVTPVSLHTLVIAESGDRKSAVESLVFRQVRKFDEERDRLYADLLAKNLIEKRAWQFKLKICQKRLAKALSEGSSKTSDIDSEFMNLLAQEPVVSRCGHILYSDFTIEALIKKLSERWPHANIISSEAAKILQNLSQQVVQLNLLWDGQSSMTMNRKIEGDTVVMDPRVSMALMVQPEPFKKFRALSGTLAGSTGLFNRMLVCEPHSLQGTRMLSVGASNTETHFGLSPFQQRVAALLIEGEDIVKAAGSRKVLQFSEDAKALWIKYANSTESWMGKGGSMEEIKGYASKSMNNISRIAAIFSYFADGSTVIQEHSLASAALLCNYYNSEFIAIFGPEGQADIPKEYARLLEEWFRRRFVATGQTIFRMGELYKEAPGKMRKKVQIEVALEVLGVEGKTVVMKTRRGQPYSVLLRLDPWGQF